MIEAFLISHNLATQIIQLPQPWEITMSFAGHFFRHAATLICVKEVSDEEYRKLPDSFGQRSYLPEMKIKVCSFPVNEKGWCDYADTVYPYEPHLEGIYEDKTYIFGSDMMFRNLELWMDAYMRESERSEEDGYLHPEYFFDDLENDFGVSFYGGSREKKERIFLNNRYVLRCYLNKYGMENKTKFLFQTGKTDRNESSLFFKADVSSLEKVYKAVKAQYDVYRRYIWSLDVEFIRDEIQSVELPQEILDRLNSITHHQP